MSIESKSGWIAREASKMASAAARDHVTDVAYHAHRIREMICDIESHCDLDTVYTLKTMREKNNKPPKA